MPSTSGVDAEPAPVETHPADPTVSMPSASGVSSELGQLDTGDDLHCWFLCPLRRALVLNRLRGTDLAPSQRVSMPSGRALVPHPTPCGGACELTRPGLAPAAVRPGSGRRPRVAAPRSRPGWS